MGDGGIWGGDMGMEGEGEGGVFAGEVSEMGVGGGLVYSGVHGAGGVAAGHVEREGGMRAWNYERKLEEGQGGELVRECWEEIKGRARRGKVLGGWGEERRDSLRKEGGQWKEWNW